MTKKTCACEDSPWSILWQTSSDRLVLFPSTPCLPVPAQAIPVHVMTWHGKKEKDKPALQLLYAQKQSTHHAISSTAKHAKQLPENPRKEFLDHLFHLGVLSTTLTMLLLLLMVLLLLLWLLLVVIILLLLWLVLLLLLLLLTPITLLITIPAIDVLHIHITTT